jgi:hypothetical protein
MRKYNHYKNEISIASSIKKGSKGADAEKIQQWINYNSNMFGSPNMTTIDRDFGKATMRCIEDFQKARNLTPTGIVDDSTFFELSKPLRASFGLSEITHNSFRELIVKVAQTHIDNKPLEFKLQVNGKVLDNRGPWVRSYCNSEEDVAWCLGFTRTIIDQACDIAGVNFTTIMPANVSLSCDDVGNFALGKGRLIRGNELKNRVKEIRSGDIFLKYSPDNGNEWHHIGLIVDITKDGIMTTIEGNSASRSEGQIGDTDDGTGAYKRTRNLFDSKILTNSKTGKKYHDYYEVYTIDA